MQADQPELFMPSSKPFRVNLIGFTAAESDILGNSIRQAGAALPVEMKGLSRASDSSFPEAIVHAIVLTPASCSAANNADLESIRQATRPGTCRVYLYDSSRAEKSHGTGKLDGFIQKTPHNDAASISKEIISFFREADFLNRRSTVLAFRDMACLKSLKILGWLWPLSYIVAALLIINAIAVWMGFGMIMAVLSNTYIAPIAIFFGIFYIVQFLFSLARNALFSIRFIKRLLPTLIIHSAAFSGLAALTAYALSLLVETPIAVLTGCLVAVGGYVAYMYCRRIRTECTSISEIQEKMADNHRRGDLLRQIGNMAIGPGTFPFLPYRERAIFISYMHGSEWSAETAARIHKWADGRGIPVFHDGSSIPSGSLWRQMLLRAISECTCFIAVLDDETDATSWVLTESAYAAVIRKNIGKPRLIVVVRSAAGLESLKCGPFGVLWADVLHMAPNYCPGAAVMIASKHDFTAEDFLQTVERVKPMSLLC